MKRQSSKFPAFSSPEQYAFVDEVETLNFLNPLFLLSAETDTESESNDESILL